MSFKWKKTVLGQCCNRIVGGGTPARNIDKYWDGNIPWITVKDFSSFSPITSQEYITELGVKNSSTNIIPAGTLITATRIGLGRAFIYQVDVSINQDMKALFLNSDCDTLYMMYWFQLNGNKIEAIGTGSTVKGITLQQLQHLEISLPYSLTVQQHIADILTSCDEVIEQTEKAIAKYQAIKTGMLQDLFTRGVVANGKLRPTPEEAPELYKDSPLGKIPKEWDILPLSELVEFIRNGTTQPQTPFVTEYPVSRIETISEGIIDYQHVGYLSQNAASYKMEVGDILFSHINSLKHIGKVALKNDDKLLFHGMNLLLIRCNNKIEATFLYYLLQRHKMVFERIANSAVNQASINQTELQKIILAKPMHNEQKAILKILAPIEKIIQKEYCSLNKYISIKQGLMKKLLTPPEGALEA